MDVLVLGSGWTDYFAVMQSCKEYWIRTGSDTYKVSELSNGIAPGRNGLPTDASPKSY